MGIGQELGGGGGQHVRLDPEVDETRSGDLERFAQVVEVQLLDDAGGNLARRLALGLGQAQRHVRLEVAELRLGGGAHLRVDAGDGLDPLGEL